LERTPVEGDQAGGGAPSPGNAMVARVLICDDSSFILIGVEMTAVP
jgi:hypothetical protein